MTPRGLPDADGRSDSTSGLADRVVAATAGDVWRLHAHLFGRADADDLTQETFLRVLRALPGYRRDASVRVWVLAIATRTATDEIRRRGRSRRLLSRLPAPAVAEPDASGEHVLADLMQALEPGRRQAFVLTQVLGYSYSETAEILGCPVGTVRSRVARARSDLMGALAGE